MSLIIVFNKYFWIAGCMPDPEQTKVNSEDPALVSVAATGREGARFKYILEAELIGFVDGSVLQGA